MIGRPKKSRIVRKDPDTKQFSPRGHRGRPGYNELKIEEFEAIRLIDHMGLRQAEAAESMGISQQTFSRVLRNARKSLGEALVLGRIIRVNGGVFSLNDSSELPEGSRHE